eukprot:6182946-Pleurochrysis_carterae.AAC.3
MYLGMTGRIRYISDTIHRGYGRALVSGRLHHGIHSLMRAHAALRRARRGCVSQAALAARC